MLSLLLWSRPFTHNYFGNTFFLLFFVLSNDNQLSNWNTVNVKIKRKVDFKFQPQKTAISTELDLGQMHLKWFKSFGVKTNAVSENKLLFTSSFLIEINSFERAGVITRELDD
jgi:hypothetical protein